MAAESIAVTFQREKETMHIVRFQEVVGDGPGPMIGTVYIAKWAMDLIDNPEQIVLEIRRG